MIFGMWVLMVAVAVIFMFYAFLRTDMANYTHILAAFVLAIVFILCGFEMLSGVTQHVDSDLAVTHASGWTGSICIVLGAIIIVYACVRGFDIAQDMIARLEDGD